MKRRVLLVIIALIGLAAAQACQVLPKAVLPIVTAPTWTDTVDPQPAQAVTPEPPTLIPTASPTPTLPPTLTPTPVDPFAQEDPEGKVLHAIYKRRFDPQPTSSLNENHPFADELLKLINEKRAAVGAPPLAMSSLLVEVAQSHSDEMAANNFFGHNSLNGVTFVDRIKKAGYEFTAAAENLFAGSGPYNSPEYVVKVWMNSPSHQENMLNPVYTQVGIGYRFNPDSTYGGYFTADFGKP